MRAFCEKAAAHLKCSPPLHRDQAVFEAAEHLDACFGVQGIARRLSEL
jgi:hypothetical protein